MATSSSSAAVAALVQKASVQYMECRRKVTAKVDEVRAIDEQLQAAFAAMDMLRERGGASARSVGRLTLTLAGVEGDAPVPAAAITVAIDPEFESDEDDFEEVEEVVEKRDVVTTDEHGHVVEAGAVPHEHEGGETPRKLKTTTKITRTIIKKKVKKAKVPVVRTVAWDAVAVEDEEEQEKNDEEQTEEQAEGDEQKKEVEEAAPKPLSFPATFVFDPVQSREAVIIITVASASEEDAEPVKEVEIPISSLFGEDVKLDKWYSFVDEAAAAVVEAAEETAEVVEEAVKVEETAKVEEAEESEKTETQDEAAEDKDEETVEGEKADEEQKEVTAEVEETAETEAVEAVEAVAEKEPAAPVSRFHVQASFVMSDIEKLSAAAMALSKKKQEADAALQALEREAASLRTKYERLNASQRTLNSSSASKPKSGLLSSRFGQPVVQKSRFQKLRESVSAVFTPQRQQVLTSVAIFVTSVAVFHYQGENLLM